MNAGPYTSISCYPNISNNHAVLLVGYNQTHWVIKNSWDTWWGDNGYGYIDKANNTGIQRYVSYIKVNLPWNPVPNTPPTPPTGSIILTIWMQDLYNDGWNDNIFGFRQNGTIVATFGAGFTTGTTYGPINVTIPGNKQTQIVVSTYGTFTDEISFTVKAINGTTIFTRLSGTGRFSA